MDARSLASAERADLAGFCRTLDSAEWERPSLCEGWRVRDVVAHLLQVDDVGLHRHVVDFIRCGFGIDRFNALGVERHASWSTEQIVVTLERQIELGWLSRTRRGLPCLAETVIHHQDVRRALGRPRTIPAERLIATLGAPDTFTGSAKRARGLRFVATDLEWSRGEGLEVRGPAEAIVMALAGRRSVLGELTGEGKAVLSERFSGPSGPGPGGIL